MPTRPNIILINCDDLGYGDLGCYGSQTIATPNLDAMASQGIRFTDMYAAAPICSPSRAGLLTGRYPVRTGITRVLFPNSPDGLPDTEITIADLLKAQGYVTACIGKWHVGCLPEFMPRRHGFDYYHGIPYSNDMDSAERGYPPTPVYRNEEIVQQPAVLDTLTQRYTEEAIGFISEHKDGPFFVYLPHTMPHVPLHASKAFRGRSKGGLYGDVVEELDVSTGTILRAVRELGLEDNTLVIFTSDNGPWLEMGEHGGSAAPLRAGKFTAFEGGMREPFIAYWNGVIPAGLTCSEPASHLDLLPTLVNLAGGAVPSDRQIDGRDITPLLAGSGQIAQEPFFYMPGDYVDAVRLGNWKLHVSRQGAPLPEPELYNLHVDIGEATNVAAGNPGVVEELIDVVEDFRAAL